MPTSPITFARLTTPSQAALVNSDAPADTQRLGEELLAWVRHRIQEPFENFNAEQVRIARLIYTKAGTFTYYERLSQPALFNPADYTYQWSSRGNALELHRKDQKWFAWYPQGRQQTKNQNQLHFHGENHFIPSVDAPNRYNFILGEPSQIPFDKMIAALLPLVQDITPDG